MGSIATKAPPRLSRTTRLDVVCNDAAAVSIGDRAQSGFHSGGIYSKHRLESRSYPRLRVRQNPGLLRGRSYRPIALGLGLGQPVFPTAPPRAVAERNSPGNPGANRTGQDRSERGGSGSAPFKAAKMRCSSTKKYTSAALLLLRSSVSGA
jgi:hypothetical protein